MPSINIATVALEVTFDPVANLAAIERAVTEAAAQGADLVVLPEQALQGYLTDTVALDLDNVAYQFAHAEVVPDGASVARIIELAERLAVHVVVGFTERDARFPDRLFNSAVLCGPDGLIGTYRKVHQPGNEKHVYFPGKGFPVFDTAIGRVGILICYDMCFPESTRELALQGADILVLPTAWAYAEPGGGAEPERDRFVDAYTLFGRVRALENQCWFVAANLSGQLGTLDYHGHSRIIDPNGTVVADTGAAPGIATARCDIAGEIVRARSVGYIGYHFLKDYVPLTEGIAS